MCLCGSSQIVAPKLTLGVNVRVIGCLSSYFSPAKIPFHSISNVHGEMIVLWSYNRFKILNTTELSSTHCKIIPKYIENL